MPKLIGYPRSSHTRAIELASAVQSMGGSCTAELAAEKMGMKISGAFATLIASTAKYGLISNSKGRLEVTQLFKDYHLGYDEAEKNKALQESFRMLPVFDGVLRKFEGSEVPLDILDRVLIKEFDVEEKSASAVRGYFVEGAQACGLITSDGLVTTEADSAPEDSDTQEVAEDGSGIEVAQPQNIQPEAQGIHSLHAGVNSDGYQVMIIGPGLNTKISLADEDDFLILEATLNKVRKALNG